MSKKPAKPEQEATKPLLDVLEQGVRDVLNDATATKRDKLAAIETGARLLQIRHKLGDTGKIGSWFDKGNGDG